VRLPGSTPCRQCATGEGVTPPSTWRSIRLPDVFWERIRAAPAGKYKTIPASAF
jgi:hypothetical protein